MLLLRLLLEAWLALGIVTVFSLYLLCKQTARRINRSDKPVMGTFQRVMPAALQNRNPIKETKAASSQTVSLPLNRSIVSGSGVRRTHRSEQFFWRAATAAVFALLLVASTDRLSPIPAALKVVHQEVPSRKVLPPTSEVAAKTTMTQPQTIRIERSVVAYKPRRRAAALTHRRIVNPARHSAYESEADMVAPDTVMRYGRAAAQ
jgi:hypothetical protein